MLCIFIIDLRIENYIFCTLVLNGGVKSITGQSNLDIKDGAMAILS